MYHPADQLFNISNYTIIRSTTVTAYLIFLQFTANQNCWLLSDVFPDVVSNVIILTTL